MRLLLDTHALVWAVGAPERLSRVAMEAVMSPENQLYLSAATAWELATKFRIGKLPGAKPLLDAYETLAQDLRARLLPISHAHAIRAGLLAGAHRDPFDRMLVAQAQLDDLRIITRDPAFGAFEVRVVW